MTAAADVDTDNLTDLDWDVVLPCEYSLHGRLGTGDQPASWIMSGACPECDHRPQLLICTLDRALLQLATTIRCLGCQRDIPRTRWAITFLPIGDPS